MVEQTIGKGIADDLQAPEGSSVTVPKSPFTDAEIQKLYAACDEIGPQLKEGPGYRRWGGEDVCDLLNLMIYTGLRISDAVLLDTKKRLKGNDVFLRMHKSKRPYLRGFPIGLSNPCISVKRNMAHSSSLLEQRRTQNSFATSGGTNG